MERVKGIEPSSSAWKAVALPLSYTRIATVFGKLSSNRKHDRKKHAGIAACRAAAARLRVKLRRAAFALRWLASRSPRSEARRLVGEVGLEPTKAKPADLQSAPFAARDIPPLAVEPHGIAGKTQASGERVPDARRVMVTPRRGVNRQRFSRDCMRFPMSARHAAAVSVRLDERPQGAVAHVTIDNAAKLNTLGHALMIDFVEQVEALAQPRRPARRGADRRRAEGLHRRREHFRDGGAECRRRRGLHHPGAPHLRVPARRCRCR